MGRTWHSFPLLPENFSSGAVTWRGDQSLGADPPPAPHPLSLAPAPGAGDARRSRPRAPAAPYIHGGRRLRRARRGGAAFEVAAAAAFILSFFPRRPLCVTKFGKNMDPSQPFHVCSQLPAEKAKGSLPGKETGRKIKEFGSWI